MFVQYAPVRPFNQLTAREKRERMKKYRQEGFNLEKPSRQEIGWYSHDPAWNQIEAEPATDLMEIIFHSIDPDRLKK